jgi:hypothetical protein
MIPLSLLADISSPPRGVYRIHDVSVWLRAYADAEVCDPDWTLFVPVITSTTPEGCVEVNTRSSAMNIIGFSVYCNSVAIRILTPLECFDILSKHGFDTSCITSPGGGK